MLMASGGFIATANNKEEALKLAKCFMDKIPETLEELKLNNGT